MSDEFKEIFRRLSELEDIFRNAKIVKPEESTCLHDNCVGCKNGTCNGVHWISCPCPKCSPRY